MDKLEELDDEFKKYYPSREIQIPLSYCVLFTAAFRLSFFIIRIYLSKNKYKDIFDFLVYDYKKDINLAKKINKREIL